MTYTYYAQTLSAARMSRYQLACNGNQRRAMTLYRLNVRLGQEFFGLLSIWEVTFRNAIDNHYRQQTGQRDWLRASAQRTGMFASARRTCDMINEAIRKLGPRYTHDRLVAELTFGFWVQLFNNLLFRLGQQSLHHIFVHRPTGASRQTIFQQLDTIRLLRNRIAHHEPLCFDGNNRKSTLDVKRHYDLLLQNTLWPGHQPNQLYYGLNHLPVLIQRLRVL